MKRDYISRMYHAGQNDEARRAIRQEIIRENTPEDEDWFELRINRQYRIYFLWADGSAHHVRVDDHL